MIIVMRSGVSAEDVEAVRRRIAELGYQPHTIVGEFKTVVAAVGEERGKADLRLLEAMETVESVMPIQQRAHLFQQPPLGLVIQHDGIKLGHSMQVYACKVLTPHAHLRLRRGREVQYGDNRSSASREHLQLVAMLSQNAIACIDHVQRNVAGQHLAQRLGFLRERAIQACIRIGEKCPHLIQAIHALGAAPALAQAPV